MLPRADVKPASCFPEPQGMVLILLRSTVVKSAGRPRKLLSEGRIWRTGWLPESDHEDGADLLLSAAVTFAGRPRKLLSEGRIWRTGWLPKRIWRPDWLPERNQEDFL